MPATDLAAPSPRGTLSRLRRKPGDSNESSNSLASSSNSDDPSASPGLRASISEGVGRKLKDRLRRKSVDDRRGSNESRNRFSNFLLDRKNKVKETDSNGLDRQLSIDSGSGNLALYQNQSDSSLGLAGSGQSSLLTDGESEHEG